MTALAAVVVDRHQLAALLGVHPDRLSEYKHAGMPLLQAGGGPGARNTYDAILCCEWVRRHRPGVLDAHQERAELDRARRAEIEQRMQTRAGQFLARDDVVKTWATEIAAVRTKLLALPATLADRLHRTATLGPVADVEAALETAIRDVLTELSRPAAPRASRRSPRHSRTPRAASRRRPGRPITPD